MYAAHQFPDVPTNSPFHSDVSWLSDQGVANGFADGTYRPTDPISRQAFTAMLRRYTGGTEVVVNTGSFSNKTSASMAVSCPVGKRSVGGDGWLFSGSDMFLTASVPSGLNFDSGWWVNFESDNNAIRSGTLMAVAICQPNA